MSNKVSKILDHLSCAQTGSSEIDALRLRALANAKLNGIEHPVPEGWTLKESATKQESGFWNPSESAAAKEFGPKFAYFDEHGSQCTGEFFAHQRDALNAVLDRHFLLLVRNCAGSLSTLAHTASQLSAWSREIAPGMDRYNLAAELYNRGEFDVAAMVYAKDAEAGNLSSAIALALMHKGGLGIEKNPNEAARLYRSVISAGHSDNDANQNISVNTALHELAIMHEMGFGVDQDYNEAIKLYVKAAAHGDQPSMVRLSEMYAQGTIIPQDQIVALAFLKLAGNEPEKLEALASKSSDDEVIEAEALFNEMAGEGGVIKALYTHMELQMIVADHYATERGG